ncbi:LysE family translocator [Algihabitans sp.]|uniref:LysE family translocator n=1 Tax=Algihabitans sp. TaxID=2821514 RepID=UPI003BAD010A
MPSADLLIPFFLASAIFACIPGPGLFYAAAQTLALGRRAGWYSAVGFHVAGLWHVFAAAFGLSALMTLVPALFTVMKLLGAAYLIYLGLTYLRRSESVLASHRKRSQPRLGRALRDSFVVEALNPKSVLFYLAFLPQFTDPAATLPLWAQIAVLGGVVNVLFTITDLLTIELSHSLARRLPSSDRMTVTLRKLGGGLLIVLGLNLALTRPP